MQGERDKLTYDDIIDWAEEYAPSDEYDNFPEWDRAVRDNFKKHRHFFPQGMTSSLAEYWEEKYDILAEETEEEIEDSKTAREHKRLEKQTQKFRERAVSAPREVIRREKISIAQRERFISRREAQSERRAQKREKFTKRLSKSERKRKRGIGR